MAISKFQSTLLQEERLSRSLSSISAFEFQSTLLQEERQLYDLQQKQRLLISIHAPTRGATTQVESDDNETVISIHAPTRGATADINRSIFIQKFQSTLLQEERLSRGTFSGGYYPFQSTLLQEERQQKCTIILILICNNYCIVSIKSHQHYNNYFM